MFQHRKVRTKETDDPTHPETVSSVLPCTLVHGDLHLASDVLNQLDIHNGNESGLISLTLTGS